MAETQNVKPGKTRFRKNLLIYPRFQLTLLLVNTLIMTAAFSFIGVQVARSFSNLKKMGLEANLPAGHPYFRFLDFQASTLYSYLGLALIAAFAISAFITLILSHRLAGPIVRMRSYFRGIAQGDSVVPLKFRRRDFFTDLPPVINEALDSIKRQAEK